ncbi:E3 SUMO-protein ligase ZBED1-like [Neoarius graeffei]|uniref:E3 SUMO-protein ligase ZBED1-like n=1 Tax=Neoarius graeffei TaxID=443677 RepID=UPI00298C2733|nr:E3 SUMO-protein ligase ZBED1-like [Neoarius graeffei]
MASGEELEDPPSSFKSVVWDNFEFPMSYNSNGERVVDKTKTVCHRCSTSVHYVSGNTSNMLTHIQRHHPDIPITGTRRKKSVQLRLPNVLQQPLDTNTCRAKKITKAIVIYIASAMRPYSTVEEAGFKYLLHVLEPRYTPPSRSHVRESVVPALYNRTRQIVEQGLKAAHSIALTTDSWTSWATESFLTVTAHFISPEWDMRTVVLQTRPLHEQHTSTHLAEKLNEVVTEWKLERRGMPIAVTTDNARNIVNAVGEAGLGPHIACFAHTLNLAAKKALEIKQVLHVLAKMRSTVAFFHRSTTAAYILERKQEMLGLPKHCLINDVATRWNSSFEMVERYLEQQAAVYSALAERNVRSKDIMNLSDLELSHAEAIVDVMKPLKTITAVISTETTPSLSMILPLQTTLLKSTETNTADSPIARDMKNAIRDNFQG